jgi:hypothetical protein
MIHLLRHLEGDFVWMTNAFALPMRTITLLVITHLITVQVHLSFVAQYHARLECIATLELV